MRQLALVILAVGCGDQRSHTAIDAAITIDTSADAPHLTCSTGHEDKIKFDYPTSCGNDGSVEFCIPDNNATVMSEVIAISSTIRCAPGGGRANCSATPGLLLCTYPTTYPGQCLTMYGAMTVDVWADMCELAAIPEIVAIVHTILE
jgi:hypothetical protein